MAGFLDMFRTMSPGGNVSMPVGGIRNKVGPAVKSFMQQRQGSMLQAPSNPAQVSSKQPTVGYSAMGAPIKIGGSTPNGSSTTGHSAFESGHGVGYPGGTQPTWQGRIPTAMNSFSQKPIGQFLQNQLGGSGGGGGSNFLSNLGSRMNAPNTGSAMPQGGMPSNGGGSPGAGMDAQALYEFLGISPQTQGYNFPLATNLIQNRPGALLRDDLVSGPERIPFGQRFAGMD